MKNENKKCRTSEKKRRSAYVRLVNNNERLKKEILYELCDIAFSDIGDYIEVFHDENGSVIVDNKDFADIDTKVISEITNTGKNACKLKLYNKESALVRLGTYLGMWKDKAENDAEDLQPLKESLEVGE